MSGPGASINMVDALTKLAIAQAAPPASDPVNRPSHYTAGSIEVIEFIEQVTKDYPPEVAYHIGNVIKYLARAPHKGNLRQDLEKGENYLRRAINRMVYWKGPRSKPPSSLRLALPVLARGAGRKPVQEIL